MPQADWGGLARDLAAELRMLTYDISIRLSLDELLRRSGASREYDGFRSRSHWAACQRGDPDWRGFRDAGLVINFVPDERGREVEVVTFRLDRSRDEPRRE